MKSYLFLLGRHSELSRAELRRFCDEVWYSEEKALFIGENLSFENPRNLPRAPEQLFLDRLGGTIRFAEILGEYHSLAEIVSIILKNVSAWPEEKIHLGFSAFGCGRSFLRTFVPEVRDQIETKTTKKLRLLNSPGENMTSGRIFEDKLLKKGFEFVIVKNQNSFLLARTVANQNIRNYTLRDRIKTFRDTKQGMLPPKLAQILLNLIRPGYQETIIDPFCGTGTVNIEAAILGYKTIGSDILEQNITLARANFEQMADKFRYEKSSGSFFVCDAKQFPKEKQQGVMVTEGYLGFNFQRVPTMQEIEKNAEEVLRLWEDVFRNLKNSPLQKCVFCLPCWSKNGKKITLSERLFTKIAKSGYAPLSLFENNQQTFFYARPDAFVEREICVVQTINPKFLDKR